MSRKMFNTRAVFLWSALLRAVRFDGGKFEVRVDKARISFYIVRQSMPRLNDRIGSTKNVNFIPQRVGDHYCWWRGRA